MTKRNKAASSRKGKENSKKRNSSSRKSNRSGFPASSRSAGGRGGKNYGASERQNRRRHIPENLRNYITGTVDMKSSGKAYILPDNKELEDVFISANNVGHALHGDYVRVLLFPDRFGRRLEGQITEVIKRNKRNIVGTVEFSGKYAFLVPDNTSVPVNIILPQENLHGAKDGQKVVAGIADWPAHMNNPIGEVKAVLGAPGDNNVEMQSILAEFDFPLSYPQAAIREAEGMSERVTPDELARRRDFREVYTCTIDPADAKDFDDALSFKRLPDGNMEIGVHIADVSHFVKPGGAIEEEAYQRATSVYLVDRTIPMLPERLCNDLCSLNPDVDRFCFSAVFEMDAEAHIKNFWIGKGIIHSNRRYTYEEAQAIIEAAGLAAGAEAAPGQLSRLGSAMDIEAITEMFKLSLLMRNRRFRTGAINFHSKEVRFRLDPVTAKPLGVYIKESKESNNLVEEFMLLANRRVAELIGNCLKVKPQENGVWGSESANKTGSFDAEKSSRQAIEAESSRKGNRGAKALSEKPKTFVYRVHDEPNPEKLAVFTRFVGKLGYKINLKNRSGLVKSFNGLLEAVEGKAEQNMIETIAVRTMAKAYYSTHNIGHYGLAFPFYTHFTSPIRRYPDLMVHRLLESYIHGGKSAVAEEYEERCEHSSDMEKRAAEAERASVKYKQAEFLLDKVGQRFWGVISGVSKWGIYVCLDDNYCEGMVPLRSLKDDYYELDDENYQVVGLRSGQVYKLGQRVAITVQEIDMNKKQLTFAFAEEEIPETKPQGRRGSKTSKNS